VRWPLGLPSNSGWRERLVWHLGKLVDVIAKGPSQAGKLYRWTRVDEPPDVLDSNLVYIVGQNGHLWSAELVCPCGCNAVIRLSLHTSGRPRWTAVQHPGGRVSLKPSIWRRVGCKSHFILHRGQIEYFRDDLPTPDRRQANTMSP
jgi:hypothetical protein